MTSAELLLAFVAALRAEGADLPESDENTISTLTDALDSFEPDELDFPDQARSIRTLWAAANKTIDPNWVEYTE